MNLLTADNISKAFTGRRLLDEASFYLQEGEKVGIIGINGTGKSTLLKIMAGLVEPDFGEVITANHVVMRYLPQSPVFQPEVSVLQSVLEAAAGKQDTIIAGEKSQDSHAVNEKIWSMESKAKSLLLELGITDFEQKTGELSGGQRKRLALAAILLVPCDILLLDEPTNHIDHEMADWLENYLKKWKGSLVMVTHDRYFLDSVSNRIVEIDKGHIYSYDTNYSGFLERKTLREENGLAGERKRQSILRKEMEWIKRGARARSTKQKARIERFETLRDRETPTEDKKLELSSISTRMGRTTVELDHVSKAYGNRVLVKDFSYIFLKQDRIGFIGKNGSGKTTLMKIIEGRLKPDSGEVIVGQTIKIGYYSQEIEEEENAGIAYMDPSMRVIDYIKNTAEYVRTNEGLVSASAMLERFLFPPEEQYGLIGKLSGGEKRRLNLLRVLMEAPNVLILDEPTNDLDIVTLSILEDYLDAYDGIVITVSHDRYFLDRIVKRIFAFEGDGVIRQYEGGYTDYVNRKKEEESKEENETVETKNMQNSKKEENQKKGKPRNSAPKLKFSYKEEREYETIEDDIAALEEKADELEQEIVKCATDFVRLNELTKEKEEVDTALLEKMERWEYLEELAAKIKAQNT
ncbi:ABC-F family ATP-binding cassette domain-containing protein [Roseburia hominis]|uniref:ABC-F family ATP-binding cassette domain-containing protein n=1 Tax=Roseburia hominis TaxID=301301 RepID=UPI001F3BF8DD|nr:ABC-F family ATP-binding cassette domain-containing protein [Roseburia hominis]